MHKSVLADEVIEYLGVRQGGTYIDGTLGSGGHAARILDRLDGDGVLLGLDLDCAALERSGKRLESYGNNCILREGNFADMEAVARECSLVAVDGVVLDLGVSSDQLETGTRGFSFMKDGPLDMRMSLKNETTAEELVNELDEAELKQVIFEYGEEKKAGRIARAIVAARVIGRISTTKELTAIVEGVVGRRGRIHPATKTFQALRMRVNRELDSLKRGLEAGLRALGQGGRMAVISFHSLEDRMVKNTFRQHSGSWSSRESGGSEWTLKEPGVRALTRRAVKPSDEEIESNPRARSARMRVIEKL